MFFKKRRKVERCNDFGLKILQNSHYFNFHWKEHRKTLFLIISEERTQRNKVNFEQKSRINKI